jgi:cell wall-associated NlpC family hydrolase
MKRTFFLFFFATCAQLLIGQSIMDSIIRCTTDEAVRNKLKRFEKGGIEKILLLDTITADDLVNSATKYLSLPHCMGGNGKTSKNSRGRTCIDCSGLLYLTFIDLGINPGVHSSQEMARYGKIIADTSLIQKGDLIFFVKSYKPGSPDIVITHSAIALGNGMMIHTSASNGVEMIPIKSEYWSSRFIFATRIF